MLENEDHGIWVPWPERVCRPGRQGQPWNWDGESTWIPLLPWQQLLLPHEPNLPLELREKAGGCARVTAGPKRPHLGMFLSPLCFEISQREGWGAKGDTGDGETRQEGKEGEEGMNEEGKNKPSCFSKNVFLE